MFDPIGEPNVRTVLRPEPTIAINEKEIQAQQEQKVRESRSIEKSNDSSEIKKEKEDQEREKENRAKYRQEEDKIVYEKYNKNGEVVFRLPPKKKPLDEIA